MVTWSIGDLAVGQVVTLNITVRINASGNIVNVANVTDEDNNTNTSGGNNSTITVYPIVNLTITKTSNATNNMSKGDFVTYTITVTNHGPDNATGVVVTDLLDHRLVFVSSDGNYTNVTGLWTIGNLSVGDSVSLNIIVWINGTGNIVNIANVTVNETNVGNNSTGNNTTNITVPGFVNLTIDKIVNSTGNASLGDLLTYTITVTNYGPDDGNGVVVTDVLDHRLVYLGSYASQGSYNPATGLWTIGDLYVNQTVTLNIFVRINGTGNIINVANVTAEQTNTGNNSTGNNTTNITVPPTVNLTITKSANTTNATIADLVTYTIVVTNHGPDNGTGVKVSDVLDSRLVYIGSDATQGVYDPATGFWTIGNLNVDQTVTLNIFVRINGTGNIVNVANVTVDQSNVGNNTTAGGNGTNITSSAVNLTISKSSNAKGNVSMGDIIIYTIVVTNHGSDSATGIRVTDVLDSRLIYVTCDPSQGIYDPSTGLWFVGVLNSGNSATLTIMVIINGVGTISNTATIISDLYNTGNNASTSYIRVTNNTGDQNNTGNNTGNNSGNNTTVNPLKTSLSISVRLSDDGKTMFITGRLVDGLGNPIPNRMIAFYVEYLGDSNKKGVAHFTGKYVGSALTDADGVARLSYTSEVPFLAGEYLITDHFPGDKEGHTPATNETILNIGDDNQTVIGGNNGSGNSSGNTANGVAMETTGVPIAALVIILLLFLVATCIIFKRRNLIIKK